jgi:hypothetical protein
MSSDILITHGLLVTAGGYLFLVYLLPIGSGRSGGSIPPKS